MVFYHSYTKKQLSSLEKVMKQVQAAYPNISMGSAYSGANGFYEQFPQKGKGIASTAYKFNQGTFTHNSYGTVKSLTTSNTSSISTISFIFSSLS